MVRSLDDDLDANLRISRILAAVLSFATPAIYVFIYAWVVLQRDVAGFLAGWRAVPWGDPAVVVLLLASLGMAGAALVAPAFLAGRTSQGRASVFGRLRVQLVIACALLESVAIFGLLLGFLLGPQAASLSLAMMLVPALPG